MFRAGRQPRAFTLVELIVVTVILAVLAGLILPRIAGNTARHIEAEAQAAQRLLSVAAERDALWGDPVAIEYDDSARELRLLVRRGAGGEVASAGAEWRPDPLLQPVVFTHARLSQAWADGRALPTARWRVAFLPTDVRPELTLQIDPAGGASREGGLAGWEITLAPDGAAAVMGSAGGGAPGVFASRSIDLDAVGRGDKPW